MQIFIKALTGGGIQAFIKILACGGMQIFMMTLTRAYNISEWRNSGLRPDTCPWRNADLREDTHPSMLYI